MASQISENGKLLGIKNAAKSCTKKCAKKAKAKSKQFKLEYYANGLKVPKCEILISWILMIFLS